MKKKETKADGFIKDYDLIQEDCRVVDLLDFSESIASFSQRLEAIDRPAILGLVGGFGTGKSTMLYQIQKRKPTKEVWITFDAWKYPDRKDLWEGFVLDVADQIGSRKKVQKKIDGKETKSQVLDFATDILSEITDKLPDLNILDKLTAIFKSSPAKRVFEIQQILSELIVTQKNDLYIVVEDIDRSGDAGIFFLETLKQFLRDSGISKTIIVIVPMGEESYNKNIDSYLKCIDYFEFFDPQNNGLEAFVDGLFEDSLFEGNLANPDGQMVWTGANKKSQVTSFLEELLKQPSITIRHLKIILRKADLVYLHQCRDGHEPDWRITICIEASKYLYVNQDRKGSHFANFQKDRVIKANTLFATFLFAMLGDRPTIYDPSESGDGKHVISSSLDFTFNKRVGHDALQRYPSHPWHHRRHHVEEGEEQVVFCLCDFYLNY